MASSKNSPGPHDRRAEGPRQTCIKQVKRHGNLARCKRWPTSGSKLCRTHLGIIPPPDPGPEGIARGGLSAQTRKRFQSASAYVVSEQSKVALRRLGDKEEHFDPKSALLDNVRSAWRQRQIWEAMLAAVPEEDWAQVGRIPIPGQLSSAKGARIETIQKFLSETTKVAVRSSKMAIDAGIEERIVRLAEEQSALIADTVRAGLIAGIGALRLSPAAEAKAIEAAVGNAATHLRQLAAGGKEIIEGVALHVSKPRQLNEVEEPV